MQCSHAGLGRSHSPAQASDGPGLLPLSVCPALIKNCPLCLIIPLNSACILRMHSPCKPAHCNKLSKEQVVSPSRSLSLALSQYNTHTHTHTHTHTCANLQIHSWPKLELNGEIDAGGGVPDLLDAFVRTNYNTMWPHFLSVSQIDAICQAVRMNHDHDQKRKSKN